MIRFSHALTGAVLALLGCAFAQAQTEASAVDDHFAVIEARVEETESDLLELYKHLHAHPELSFHEEQSAARMAEELSQLGFTVTTGVGGHGVVAVLEQGEGPTLMIRADMDALPVKEETGLPYASSATTTDESGSEVAVMHACGHDVHMTCLIGTARILTSLKNVWNGTLVLIAQPAEERGAGAKAMLNDGLFQRFPRPDYAIALHVDPLIESGMIGYVSGYAMANVDSVDISVYGIGGHGAYPHMTKDPIVIAARIIVDLQTIVSREIAPIDPVVITVGSIHGGTKHNVIPNDVKLQLTVRSYSDETRDHLLKAIERVAVNAARLANVPDDLLPTVEVKDEYTPAVYHHPELVTRVTSTVGRLLGSEKVVEKEPVMGGEDFGRYGREAPAIPIFMLRLGSVSPDRVAASKSPGGPPLPSLHSSRYAPDAAPTLTTGVKAMSAAALDLLIAGQDAVRPRQAQIINQAAGE